jgi:DNA-binding response OmpR family regulator
MIDILTVSANASFGEFNDEIGAQEDVAVLHVDSGSGALDSLSKKKVDLVVIDESLNDMAGLDLARKVAIHNPLATVALVSALSAKAFHEATEGLGILTQLPPRPKRLDARLLMVKLIHVLRMTRNAGA